MREVLLQEWHEAESRGWVGATERGKGGWFPFLGRGDRLFKVRRLMENSSSTWWRRLNLPSERCHDFSKVTQPADGRAGVEQKPFPWTSSVCRIILAWWRQSLPSLKMVDMWALLGGYSNRKREQGSPMYQDFHIHEVKMSSVGWSEKTWNFLPFFKLIKCMDMTKI